MAPSKKEMLQQAKTIAVIGCSSKKYRTSYHIANYLQQSGYRIVPINPDYDEILGEKVYNTLQDIPENIEIHIADIFRNKKYTAQMVDQVIERVQSSGYKTVIWTQLDVSSDEAEKKAEKAGLSYIKNECIMVEHQKLLG